MLPHQYEKKDIEDMFPLITAPEKIVNDQDWIPEGNDGEWNEVSGREREATHGRPPCRPAEERPRVRGRDQWPSGR